jgi:hypothetical protein
MAVIGLVASSNGLGHARRLMFLGQKFITMGFSVNFFLSGNQAIHLKNELRYIDCSTELKLIEISNYGIDGPVWDALGGKTSKPSAKILYEIQKCSLLISDNSIWPIKYNSAFVLFGHFNWLDYWSIMGTETFSKEALDVFNEESSWFESINCSFQFMHFLLDNGRFKVKPTNLIKLLRYPTDLQVDSRQESLKEIWIANGTTGLHSEIHLGKTKLSNYEIVYKESFKLKESKFKPELIIGRPGLGTIRDCLASGTKFLPFYDDSDAELSSNVKNLEKLLLYKRNSETEKLTENLILSTLEDMTLTETWETKWKDISESIDPICEKIVTCI